MKGLLVALIFALSGCSILGDRRVAAGCQVADGITTYVALKKGAVEANPFLNGVSPGTILLIKLLFAWVIWQAFPEEPKKGSLDEWALGAVSVMGCVPAINNYNVIQKLP